MDAVGHLRDIFNLAPYILAGTLALVVSLIAGVNRALKLANWPYPARKQAVSTISAVLVAWCLVALASSLFGLFRATPTGAPTLPFALLIPIAAGILLARRWELLAQILDAVPGAWLVGVQFFRVLGLIFVILYAQDRLPGAFALPAGIGDFIVGMLAPVVAIIYARRQRQAAGLVRAWNYFGIADLIVAVTTGFLTSPSRLQSLALNVPNRLISIFPLVIIPAFLVPLAILLHLASLKKLRQAENSVASPQRKTA